LDSQPGKSGGRSNVLDALRAVAILLVLGRHAEVSELWTRIGWCGVDLFFVLSGFLISGLLFQEYKRVGNICLKTFWLRRGLKIYPAFYVCTLVQTLVYILLFGKLLGTKVVFHRFLIDATFLSSYFEGVSGHVWSLAVEEHFYFLLPVFLLVLMKVRGKRPGKTEDPFSSVPFVFLLIAAVSLVLRMVARPASFSEYYSYLLPTHLRMDGLFCGVTVGYLFHFKPELLARWARWPMLVAGIVLLTPVYYLNVEYWHMYTWGLTCTFLGFACVMTWAIHLPFRKNHLLALPINLLARIGFYSYSIYLWHWMIFFYLRPYIRFRCMKTGSPFAWSSAMEHGQWLFCIASSILVGVAMAVIIEQPALKLRDRWFPSRTRQLKAAAATA